MLRKGLVASSPWTFQSQAGKIQPMFAFKTLERRLIVLLVIPVTVFLLITGALGYRFIQGLLFREWQEVAILRLERAAHLMDMRLESQIRWMESFAQAGLDPHGTDIQKWLLQLVKSQPGVTQVKLLRAGTDEVMALTAMPAGSASLSGIRYFFPPGGMTVGLRGELLDKAGKPLGRLEVVLSYDYLMEEVLKEGWMVAQMACLVNDEGQYLAHSNPAMRSRHCLGETRNPLELAMLKDMKVKPYGVIMGEGYFPEHVIGYYKLQVAPWAIMLHARGSQIMAPILQFRLHFLAGVILCLFVTLVLIRLGVKPTVIKIKEIAHRAGEVARGRYGEPLPVNRQDEIGLLTQSFNDMVAGLKERDFISNTFGRYVDPEIARELLSRPEAARLGGEKREVVILVADIRDFTPLAETLSPEETIRLVNRHFSRMIEVIQQHRGIIVDFLGDAILVFFDPLGQSLTPTAHQAVQCAWRMQQAMAAENVMQPQAPPLYMGIGLHAGKVVVGNIGSESRAKYGIIGAAVNLTHRIQGQAHQGEVVISAQVFQQVEDMVAVSRTFEAELKGIAQPVTLHVVEKSG
jgi:adenylate cyclase